MKEYMKVGIDIGSTTTKIVALERETENIICSNYHRHNANQVNSVYEALSLLKKETKEEKIKLVLTGSGAKILSEALGLPYVQEVVANSIAIKEKNPNVRTAIELGGQDAKMIFFHQDEETGNLNVADMRMNGSCAGGTGAFIDEIAAVLKVPVEEFDALAKTGKSLYDISGRCGVYAKTDIQPLLNQGIDKGDIALSSLHAIAKQTIGGLAQGLTIEKPVAFEGGPLFFQPTLIRVFAERFHLKEEDIVIPENPQLMIAYGAALSFNTIFQEAQEIDVDELMEQLQQLMERKDGSHQAKGVPFFASKEEEFKKRHPLSDIKTPKYKKGEIVKAYLGIDSGSTTTKFVLMNEAKEVIDSFYASNEGEPLQVAKKALIAMREKFEKQGVTLDILGVGTTGYGEKLFAKALAAEVHTVETVAHAKATGKYVDDATFILDIGGQDMKAIWLDHGIITQILVNEACSSGCGSFLENFASSLHIPVQKIQEEAFASKNPAVLGSRCTVFMNSSIVTEQRNGKLPGDVMAGLCRSIIENVFTKVIRVSNVDDLGDKIVVQGGTFQNDAVLRALEQYIGKEVTRAPYPGMMGAIGAALLVKERSKEEGYKRTFIGLDQLDSFTYTSENSVVCPFCGNHCKRAILTFSTGETFVTNNRCERGEIIGDPKDAKIREQIKERGRKKKVPDLFELRSQLLFKEYPYDAIEAKKGKTVGIPRVLSYWETMPFWSTFWKSLGYDVCISKKSDREMYEEGLQAVPSDTVCFPAKLVHGHIRSLAKEDIDFIFMPSITTVASENTEKTSISMCGVVKGYPIVIQNSDNPDTQWNVPFENPLFHWYTNADRNKQLVKYMKEVHHIVPDHTKKAIKMADDAQETFHRELKSAGARVIKEVTEKDQYAVILAARPYQNDSLVNHSLSKMFTEQGIPVLTADSVPGLEDVDLKNSRIDVVNNYHARMLGSAIMAAQSDHLEYVQIVSFGCGHDAYLSDEIMRMMKEISGKTPLVLKLDESDVQGALRIRVRSFTETVEIKRKKEKKLDVTPLQDPYPVKFDKKAKKEKIVLVPNTSHAFSRIMAAALKRQGVTAVPLPIGRENAIRLGKKYVHNDICFPAQIVIGEALDALESGAYDHAEVSIAMGKYIGCCRLTHYGALLRKALDDAGYEDVAILTNDDVDYHDLHPGFKMNLASAVSMAYALPMIDVLEELLRKMRPYELEEGSANEAFERAMDALIAGLEKSGIKGAKAGFKKAIDIMKEVKYDRSNKKPTVLIVGEYLLNFHPGANHDIEDYLEKNGFEIIEARMTDVIQKTYFYQDSQIKEYHLKKSPKDKAWYQIADKLFDMAHDMTDKIAMAHPLYEPACRIQDLAKESDPVIHHTYDSGEGILIPGEIIHQAEHGCKNFVILQPFGCIPNHVVGRGIVKKLKEMYPGVQILPLDYDPDVSFANVENRLQMLIMNAKM